MHGPGYERIASPGRSDRTIRRRVTLWAGLGLTRKPHEIAPEAYGRVIGLRLEELSVDGCTTKAPGGGEAAGRSPVGRGKQGLKRSVAVEGAGVPPGLVATGADRHDSPLLKPTPDARTQVGVMPDNVNVHLDRGYGDCNSRALLGGLGFTGEIARRGVPAHPGRQAVGGGAHAFWMNGCGRLRRCAEKDGEVVDFCLYLAAALVTLRVLVQRARTRYRWDTRPTTRRLK